MMTDLEWKSNCAKGRGHIEGKQLVHTTRRHVRAHDNKQSRPIKAKLELLNSPAVKPGPMGVLSASSTYILFRRILAVLSSSFLHASLIGLPPSQSPFRITCRVLIPQFSTPAYTRLRTFGGHPPCNLSTLLHCSPPTPARLFQGSHP